MEKGNAEDIYNQGISHLNVGTGQKISIMDLANMITKVVGYDGEIEFDRNKPDSIPKKLLDSS